MKVLFFILILFYAQVTLKTYAAGEDIATHSSSKNYLFIYNEGASISGATGIEIKVDGSTPQERAINFAKIFGGNFGLNLADNKYKVKTQDTYFDDFFEKHRTILKVFYKNIPFDSHPVDVEENIKGEIVGFSGYIPPVLDKYTKPAISLSQAIANAKTFLHKGYENPIANLSLGGPIEVINNSKLVLRNSMKYLNKKLASQTMAEWRIQYNGQGVIYVNAITGQVSSVNSGIRIGPPRGKLP